MSVSCAGREPPTHAPSPGRRPSRPCRPMASRGSRCQATPSRRCMQCLASSPVHAHLCSVVTSCRHSCSSRLRWPHAPLPCRVGLTESGSHSIAEVGAPRLICADQRVRPAAGQPERALLLCELDWHQRGLAHRHHASHARQCRHALRAVGHRDRNLRRAAHRDQLMRQRACSAATSPPRLPNK